MFRLYVMAELVSHEGDLNPWRSSTQIMTGINSYLSPPLSETELQTTLNGLLADNLIVFAPHPTTGENSWATLEGALLYEYRVQGVEFEDPCIGELLAAKVRGK